jgi:hypothetical protein
MYDTEALLARQSAGEPLVFRPFWGHTGTGVGSWVLSQWWPAPFTVDGLSYATAEHWMMAEKARIFGDLAAVPGILAARSPGAAKALGRAVAGFDEDTWVLVRYAVVRNGSVEKFRQNPDLLAWLLSTRDDILVEASPRDRIWGIGIGPSDPAVRDVSAWKGQNLLGFALMDARDRLRRFPRPALPAGAVAPPWIAFPHLPRGDIGWRMGHGEDHFWKWHAWWSGLTPDERVQVELLLPARGPWSGFYDANG